PLIVNDSGHPLTINGQGATLTRAPGAPTMRFVNVLNATLNVNSLTFSGGVNDNGISLNSADAGALLDAGGAVTLNDCTFLNNKGTRAGGAIVIDLDGSSLVANRCVFRGNAATDDQSIGGAIASLDQLTVAITNCTFDSNTCTDNGGAIFTS